MFFGQIDHAIVLENADDGVDIVAYAARKPMSHGLTRMRARVRCLDGKISIDGKPGDGILIRVELPALNLG